MTLNELKTDVAMLGFENYVENEDCFIASLNRALNLLYVDRPVSKTMTLSFSAPHITFKKDFIEHHCGENITYAIKGRSLSFRTTGNGECIIRDKSGSSLIYLNKKNQLTKVHIISEGSITFRGDFYYTISNLAVFDDVTSMNVPDIPEYTPRKEIAPSDYSDDFRSFAGLPCDAEGNPVGEAILRDGRISMPFEFTGDLYLTYYRLPNKVTADDPNARIDVSDECAVLLPLLTASFMWLDDDAGKAQYYMSLYRDAIANIKRFSTIRINTEYRTNGWA